jgi:hypothetical protein
VEGKMKMRKSLIITLLVLVGAAVPSVAPAQECQYHNVKIDYGSANWLDEPMAYYDACLEVGKVVGTLNGSYLVCFYDVDVKPDSEIFGNGFDQILAVKYYTWLSTKKGDIEFIEWGWYDGDFGLETGFSKVTGGTGNFEDAFGTLSWPPRFPNLGKGIVVYEGYICTP